MEVAYIETTSTGDISYIVQKGTNKKFAWKVQNAEVLSKISTDPKTGRLCIKIDLATDLNKSLMYTIEKFKNLLIDLQVQSRTEKQTKDFIKSKFIDNNYINSGCYKFEIGLTCQFIKCINKEPRCYKDDYHKLKSKDHVDLIIEYVGFKRSSSGYENIYLVKQVKRHANHEISEKNLYFDKNVPNYGDTTYNKLYNDTYGIKSLSSHCESESDNEDDDLGSDRMSF